MDKTARPRLGRRSGRIRRDSDARAHRSHLMVNAVCVKDCIAFVSTSGRVVPGRPRVAGIARARPVAAGDPAGRSEPKEVAS